jgi:hypothetical protein
MNGEEFDNRRPVNTHWTDAEIDFDIAHPWLDERWRKAETHRQAIICDKVMVELGTILAQRQFDSHYAFDRVTDAMKRVRRA